MGKKIQSTKIGLIKLLILRNSQLCLAKASLS